MELSHRNDIDLESIELRETAEVFVRRQLQQGSRMSTALAQKAFTSIRAMLPRGADRRFREEFRFGGTGGNRFVWVAEIESKLTTEERTVAVADGWQAGPQDDYLAARQYYLLGNEVSFFSTQQHRTAVENLFRWASSYPSILFVSKSTHDIEPGHQIARDVADELVRNASLAFVGAYDEETYLRVEFAR